MTTKVLIIDDSALMRGILSEFVRSDPELELVGSAPDAYIAKDMVIEHKPDVITLDIEMPKVDGLTFLDRLMKARPTPVIMISTLTEKGADATIRSLELGAIDFIPKPKIDVARGMEQYQKEIIAKIKVAAKTTPKSKFVRTRKSPIELKYSGTEIIVGIGASTGGTEAIKQVLMELSPSFPGIVITQHMPPNFTKSFAQRLDSLCAINVREAQDGERILPGNAYIAPGDRHLEVKRYGADYQIKLKDGARVSGHKPSVDTMFSSLAKVAGKNTVACILTGMGKDGAKGMVELKLSGADTMVQNEQTCVVYGMPKAAFDLGATDIQLDIKDIAKALTKSVENKGAGTRL